MTGRAAAVGVLMQVIGEGRSLTACLDSSVAHLDDRRERAFARELCFGVLRWLPRLEAILGQLVQKSLRRKDTDIRVLLLLGLFQLIHTRVPPHAAVAETVAAARDRGKPWASGLVNAVLRRFTREAERITAAADRDDAAALAHPRWFLDAAKTAWPGCWRAILEANNQRPPMVLRVNAHHTSRNAYIETLAEAGMRACPAPHTSHGVALAEPVDVTALPGFEAGRVSVQDGAAQLAAEFLDPRPGERVLDACAAPGGKTAHLLERQRNLRVVAVDKDADRVARLEQGLRRLGLDAQVIHADAATPSDWWDGEDFDRILLDAPCSASGVVRRHPDIKLHRRPEDLARLARTQSRLMREIWPLLARRGTLLYATCSIFPQENEQILQEFLQSHTDARLLPMPQDWGHAVAAGRQVLPGEEGMDGFYYGLLEKA